MDLKDILSISGQPGLYQIVSQGKNAIIVENLETGKRMPAHARHKISTLEDIAIFTDTEDKPLRDVFQVIYKKMEGKEFADPKKLSGSELKETFENLLPDYDRDRVYTSDMKKVLGWYNILVSKGMIDLAEAETETETDNKPEDKAQDEAAEDQKEEQTD